MVDSVNKQSGGSYIPAVLMTAAGGAGGAYLRNIKPIIDKKGVVDSRMIKEVTPHVDYFVVKNEHTEYDTIKNILKDFQENLFPTQKTAVRDVNGVHELTSFANLPSKAALKKFITTHNDFLEILPEGTTVDKYLKDIPKKTDFDIYNNKMSEIARKIYEAINVKGEKILQITDDDVASYIKGAFETDGKKLKAAGGNYTEEAVKILNNSIKNVKRIPTIAYGIMGATILGMTGLMMRRPSPEQATSKPTSNP